MSMSNTKGNASPDISMLKGQSPRPEWPKEQNKSNDPHDEKDPKNGLNYKAKCYVVFNN